VAVKKQSKLICLCPLEGVIDSISKKWALLIINEIGNHGRIRFNNIMREIKGIGPKSLTQTLKDLKEKGLIRSQSFNEKPPRVEYSLLKDGKELRKLIIPLLQWATARKGSVVGRCSCLDVVQLTRPKT